MKEQEIQRSILDWLEKMRICHWRCNLGGVRVKGARIRNPMKGFPDIAGVVPDGKGRLFAIEVKQPGGRFSLEQVEWMTRLTGQGVLYITATSVDEVAVQIAR